MTRRQILYRVTFRTWDGAILPAAHLGKPAALTDIAKRMATGAYAKAMLTKVALPTSRYGREHILATETFEPTQRAA